MCESIAYLAPELPATSETFVYREVRGLRKLGWNVVAASLRQPRASAGAGFSDLLADLVVVYRREWLRDSASELLANPSRSLSTLVRACQDAALPGESLAFTSRIRLVVQAFAALGLAGRFRARGVRHIRAHFAHAPTSVAMYAALQLGVSFSFTGHANDLFQRRALLKRKLQRAGFVACITAWHRAMYERILPRDEYFIIRCGVDTAEWMPTRIRDSGGRPIRVLTVCRLVDKKGIDVLLRALSLLARPTDLTVAGTGPDSSELQRLAREIGVANHVRWLGAVDNKRVRDLMAEADVFVLPCRTDAKGDRDGLPVVLIEAMASGVPVICGDLPAIHELIEHERCGLFVPENDHESLARELEGLTDTKRRLLAAAARERVEREYSLDETISRLDKAIRTALERPLAAVGPVENEAERAVVAKKSSWWVPSGTKRGSRSRCYRRSPGGDR